MSDLTIGQWSSGHPIDISGVPMTIQHTAVGAGVSTFYEAAHGGAFRADYRLQGHDGPHWIYGLSQVEEIMPPRPPQIQGFGEDVRLPMMERGGYSPTREAERRKQEWAEAIRVA